jgi:hypothetical protein
MRPRRWVSVVALLARPQARRLSAKSSSVMIGWNPVTACAGRPCCAEADLLLRLGCSDFVRSDAGWRRLCCCHVMSRGGCYGA